MLRQLEDEIATLVIFDPQYRAVLDKLAYGTQGRQKAREALPQMSDADIAHFMEEIERVLRPGGHIGFWCDKFSVCSGHHLRYFRFTRRLQFVDMLAWNTMRFGMGARFRGATEYLIMVQKLPLMARGKWTDNSMRDNHTESSDRSLHTHCKPYALTERLIRATTKRGDLVVDPCAGSYTVLEACKNTGREFVGCDLI